MFDFHFIRPLWLLAIIPAVIITILHTFRRDSQRAWKGVIAEHLLNHVIYKEPTESKKLKPHILLGIVMILSSVALAGPSWVKEPSPFADDTAALVIALEVTPTMLAQDIRPNRIDRAVQKIKDLLALRKGSKAALVAYAGSAHLVLPLTEDSDILTEFAAELDPAIMPAEGDAAHTAVELAQQQLLKSSLSGSILLVTDGVSEESLVKLETAKSKSSTRVHLFGIGAGPEAVVPLGSPPAPPISKKNLQKAADAGRGSLILITPDSRDVDELARVVETQFAAAVGPDGGARWKDYGYWLVPLVALCCLWWFRPGWTIPLAPVAIALVFICHPAEFLAGDANSGPYRVSKGRFWFQLPDQKAQRFFDDGDYEKAAHLFTSPARRGVAWFRASEFEKAAAAFGRIGGADGVFNRGNALVYLGQYEKAIQSYTLALEERPGWKEASENLEVARLRLAKLTPDKDELPPGGVGNTEPPDEIVFDNRAKDQEAANAETIAGAGEELSDEAMRALWLRRVESRPADFLRRKFAYQYQKARAGK